MPTKFFEVTLYDMDPFVREQLSRTIERGLACYVNKYNVFFNKNKFPKGRHLRIMVTNHQYPDFLSPPTAGVNWTITISFNNYDLHAFLSKSQDEIKLEIIQLMQKAATTVCAEFGVEYSDFDKSFHELLSSDYKNYQKRVSKIFVSPAKKVKAYFLHEIELTHTNVYLICESGHRLKKVPIYLNTNFGDTPFSYLHGETSWKSEKILEVSNETKEVVHTIDIENETCNVHFYPQNGWSAQYLSLKLQRELSRTQEEWKSLNDAINTEFKEMREHVWLNQNQ